MLGLTRDDPVVSAFLATLGSCGAAAGALNEDFSP